MSYAAATVLALAAFLGLGIGRIHGFATFGEIPLGDAAQALNAISLFADADGWRWPLLSFHHPGRETVETIILADGIPLYAGLVKGLASLGIDVPLLATWRLLTVLGQAVATVWLLRAFGVRQLSLVVLGCGLSLLMPAFLFRGHANHLALSAHAVPIAGAAAAIALRRTAWPQAAAVWSGLLAASLLVHPYFLAMNAGLFSGWLVQRALLDGALRDAATALVAAALSLGGVVWAGGYAAAAGMAGNAGGFGHYSMNLLGPFAVTQGWFVPGPRILDATGGQYEGYSYLGLATLLLLAGAIATVRPSGMLAVKRHAGVLLAAIGLTVFAVSDTVYVGPWHVADLSGLFDHLPVLPEVFRSSGRMVWPVCYLLLAVGVARASVWWPTSPAAGLLACLALLGLQAADVRPMAVRWFETPVSGFNHPAWRTVFQAHERLAVYPPSGCTETNEGRFINPEYAYAARRYGLTTNSFPAEIARTDCPQAIAALDRGRLASDTLYVFHPSVADYTTIVEGPGRQACRRFRQSYICSARPAVFDAAPFLATLTSPVAGLDLEFGRRYPLGPGSEALALLARGWYAPEAWGTWSRSGEASLLLPRDVFTRARATGAQRIRLELGARAFLAGPVKQRRVDVFVADEKIDTWVIATEDNARDLSVAIPTDGIELRQDRPVRVVLEISDELSPAAVGASADTRSLGLGVSWLRITLIMPSASGRDG